MLGACREALTGHNSTALIAAALLMLGSSEGCAETRGPAASGQGSIQFGDVAASQPSVRATKSPDGRAVSILFDNLQVSTDGSSPGAGAVAISISVPVTGIGGSAFAQLALRGEAIAQAGACSVELVANAMSAGHSYGGEGPVALSLNLGLKVPGSLRVAILGSCTLTSTERGASALLGIDSLDVVLQSDTDPKANRTRKGN